MAFIENYDQTGDVWRETLREMPRADLVGTQLVQRGAEDALKALKKFGVTEQAVDDMLESLREGLFTIHEVANERGITLVGYTADEVQP